MKLKQSRQLSFTEVCLEPVKKMSFFLSPPILTQDLQGDWSALVSTLVMARVLTDDTGVASRRPRQHTTHLPPFQGRVCPEVKEVRQHRVSHLSGEHGARKAGGCWLLGRSRPKSILATKGLSSTEMVCFEEEESGLAAKRRQQQTSFDTFLVATL